MTIFTFTTFTGYLHLPIITDFNSFPNNFIPTFIALSKELHAHDGEDEDDDTKDECEVTESTDSFPHDGDEKVEGGPGLGQLKHSQLKHNSIRAKSLQSSSIV